jgi:hypothetical protein
MGGDIPLLPLYAFMVCTEKAFTFYQMYDGDKPGAKHHIVATTNEARIFCIRNKFGDKKL